jgi:hypothetical protein
MQISRILFMISLASRSIFGLLVALGLWCAVEVTAAPTSAPKPGLELARLKELDNPSRSPAQRANLGLRLYRDEMVNPTPRPGPPYTSVVTHDYVLAQITRKLAESDADAVTLRKTWERMNPGEVKDSLAIALLLRETGKAKVKSQKATGDGADGDAKLREDLRAKVAAYVLDRQHPLRLRELGVVALGRLAVQENDASLGPTLAQVIREDVQGQYKTAPDAAGKGGVLVFPVRRAAAEAIQAMDKAGMLLESYVTAAAKQAQFEVKLSPPPVRPAAATK